MGGKKLPKATAIKMCCDIILASCISKEGLILFKIKENDTREMVKFHQICVQYVSTSPQHQNWHDFTSSQSENFHQLCYSNLHRVVILGQEVRNRKTTLKVTKVRLILTGLSFLESWKDNMTEERLIIEMGTTWNHQFDDSCSDSDLKRCSN